MKLLKLLLLAAPFALCACTITPVVYDNQVYAPVEVPAATMYQAPSAFPYRAGPPYAFPYQAPQPIVVYQEPPPVIIVRESPPRFVDRPRGYAYGPRYYRDR